MSRELIKKRKQVRRTKQRPYCNYPEACGTFPASICFFVSVSKQLKIIYPWRVAL
jgi:hypothetical protein